MCEVVVGNMLYGMEESAVVSNCCNGNGMLYVLRVSFRCTLVRASVEKICVLFNFVAAVCALSLYIYFYQIS